MKSKDEEYFCNVVHKVFNEDGTIRVCERDSDFAEAYDVKVTRGY